MNRLQLILATNNFHKVNEIRESGLLSFNFKTLADINFDQELPETTGTFEGNAMQKARIVWSYTGQNCLADDSGLCVSVLNGHPGVDSAIYAGSPPNDKENVELLLKNLNGETRRDAFFITVMALIFEGSEYTVEGKIYGIITESPQGEYGFGYDSVFIPDGFKKTFAQMNDSEKNKISHRKIALENLTSLLKRIF